jgi:hypothetical protein
MRFFIGEFDLKTKHLPCDWLAMHPGESWILHVLLCFWESPPVLAVLGPGVSNGEAPVVFPRLAAKRAVLSFPHLARCRASTPAL